MDMSGQTHNNVLSLFLFKYGAMDKVRFWMTPKSSMFDYDSNTEVRKCLLSFGAEPFFFQVAIQKFKD
jgi:hypothetical protein